MSEMNSKDIYELIKNRKGSQFDEAKHCVMMLEVMTDKNIGSFSGFCTRAMVSDKTMYKWLANSELFQECYALGKMFAREHWEEEGRELREEIVMPGASNNKLEYWKTMGWAKFGIGRVNKIRLNLDPNATPNEHYAQLIKQAGDGDFTASEIKQLMESINVGLNTHQVFKLQQEIDQLRADLAVMSENNNADNTFADKGIKKKD